MRSVIAMALGLALSGSALASDADAPWSSTSIYTGAKLFSTHSSSAGLSEDEMTQISFAYGWLVGAENALEATGLEGRSSTVICAALPPSPRELATEYVSYMDANPKAASTDAIVVLVEALRQKYPCK